MNQRITYSGYIDYRKTCILNQIVHQCLSICLSIYLSIYLSLRAVCLSNQFIHLHIYLYLQSSPAIGIVDIVSIYRATIPAFIYHSHLKESTLGLSIDYIYIYIFVCVYLCNCLWSQCVCVYVNLSMHMSVSGGRISTYVIFTSKVSFFYLLNISNGCVE